VIFSAQPALLPPGPCEIPDWAHNDDMGHKQTRYSVLFVFEVLSFSVLMSVVPISGAVHRNRPPSQVKKSPMPQRPALLIDEFSNPERMSALGTFWRGFTDQVMGGVSTATSRMETIEGRRALRLVGDVSLENNGQDS
jgi:hypothetical protein